MIYAFIGYAVLSLAAIVYVVRWGMSAKDGQIAAVKAEAITRGLLGDKTLEADRLSFELKTKAEALATSERVTTALSEELADAIESVSLGAGLLSGDVRGRLQRIAKAHQAAAAVGGVPTVAVEAVPREAAPGGSRDALMSPDD